MDHLDLFSENTGDKVKNDSWGISQQTADGEKQKKQPSFFYK